MPPVPCPPRPSPPLSAVLEKKSRSQKTIEDPPRGTSPPLGDEVQPLSERPAVASTLFFTRKGPALYKVVGERHREKTQPASAIPWRFWKPPQTITLCRYLGADTGRGRRGGRKKRPRVLRQRGPEEVGEWVSEAGLEREVFHRAALGLPGPLADDGRNT